MESNAFLEKKDDVVVRKMKAREILFPRKIVNQNNLENFVKIESRKLQIFQNNKIYEFEVSKGKNQLLIEHKKYKSLLGNEDLKCLSKTEINSLDEAFKYCISSFEENRVQIKDKVKKKYILLLFTIYALNKKKSFEVWLKKKDIPNQEKKHLHNNKSEYEEQNQNLKTENKILKKTILDYKEQKQNLESENNSLKNFISNYQLANQYLENENKSLKDDIFNFQVRIQNVENENNSLKYYISNCQVKNQYLESENKLLKFYMSDCQERIQFLENENKSLKNDISNYKVNNEIKKLKNKSNYNIETSISFSFYNTNIKPNKVINDSFAYDYLDNTFTLFKSINNQLYLIYANKSKSIIIFDIIGNKKINEIKNAHNNYITNFRHYWDKINNRDLIMSISGNDNNLKVWEFKNLDCKCICNIENINNTGALNSACIFNYNEQNYIITSNDIDNDTSEDKDPDIDPESIKVYDFNGNKIKEINDSKFRTYILSTYDDIKMNKTYIIAGNKGSIHSYDYDKNGIYFRYSEYPNNVNKTELGNCSIIINSYKNMTGLFETCWDGNIRIWNFHKGELITKIKIGCWQGICLSKNNKYLYVGCDDCIKIINLKNGKIIKSLKAHDKEILTIKSTIHPQMGEILISQGAEDGQIKFWPTYNVI